MYRISCDQKLETETPTELYSGGVCTHCLTGMGARDPARVRRLRNNVTHEAIFTINGLYVLSLYGPELQALLVRAGLSESDFAPAEDSRGRKYWELLPGTDLIRSVGIKPPWGLRGKAVCCPQCDRRAFVFGHREFKSGEKLFITRSAADRIGGGVAVAGCPEAPQVLLDINWTKLAKTRKFPGLAFEKIGIVPDAQAELPVSDCTPIPPRNG
jgi:hypothetical protein